MNASSRPVADPPDPGHVETLDRLRSEAAAFVGNAGDLVDAWRSAVEEDVAGAIARRCRDLAERHAGLAGRLPGPGDGRRAAWEAIRAYAGAAADEVWAVVVGELDAAAVLGGLSDRSDDALQALEEEASGLSGPTVVPLDLALFDPAENDRGAVRMQKGWFRLRRRQRMGRARTRNALGSLFGRDRVTVPAPVRALSLQSHALALVRGPVRDVVLTAESAARDALSEALSRAQVLASRWTPAVLSALDRTDRGAWHVPGEGVPGIAVSPGVDDEEWAEALSAVRLAAESVTAELRSIADAVDALDLDPSVRDDLQAVLARALDEGGTVLLAGPEPVPDASVPARPAVRGSADRSRLASEVVGFRVDLADAESEFHHVVADGVLAPLARSGQEIRDALSRIGADTLALVDEGRDSEALQQIHDGVMGRLAQMVRSLPQPERAEDVFRAAAERVQAGVASRIETLPEELRLPVGLGRHDRLVPLAFRAAAARAFEGDLEPRIMAAYRPVQRELVRIWNDSEHLLQVVDSTFGAAREELDAAQGEGDAERRESAHGLIDDGLRRAAEILEDGYESLGAPWTDLAESVHRLLRDDWMHLERAAHADDFLAKHWQGLRARLRRRVEHALRAAREDWERLSANAVVLFRAARVRIARIVRLGRAAVGGTEVHATERIRTLEAVTGAAELYAGLPLIYRKLFTLDPLSEKGLAVNRQGDLVAVVDAFERWNGGTGPGLFIASSAPGSGLTSFLNLVARTLADRARIVRVPLPERVDDESVLARHLGRALDLDGEGPETLADLERAIQASDFQTGVVLVDDVEHVMLQTPGGTRLVEDLLLFFARTDASLFWCASIGDLAWRFLERTVPAATGLATGHALAPWDRETIQALVMERHRRTGMPLRFEEPDDPAPILRQRLRRARTPEQTQRLLRDEFFDALFRSAGQDPALALYGWVRMGRFDEEGDELTLSPFRALSFSFLNRMDNDRAFVLRAFLTHHTLSPEELARIFRFRPDQAMANLETLLALGLIEPVTEGAPTSYVVSGTRYQLRRLVLQPVRRFLTERHFVY
jgi:hypothetical protein